MANNNLGKSRGKFHMDRGVEVYKDRSLFDVLVFRLSQKPTVNTIQRPLNKYGRVLNAPVEGLLFLVPRDITSYAAFIIDNMA